MKHVCLYTYRGFGYYTSISSYLITNVTDGACNVRGMLSDVRQHHDSLRTTASTSYNNSLHSVSPTTLHMTD